MMQKIEGFAVGSVVILVMVMILCSMCGCSTIPALTSNSLDWQTATGQVLNVEGHKDTIIKGLKVTMPDGTVIEMDEYISAANAAAIEQGGAYDKAMAANMSLVATLIDKVLAGVVK